MTDCPLAEAQGLARTLWRLSFAEQNLHRIPRQCAAMLATIGSELEAAEGGRYTQTDFINAVIGQLEQMQAVNATIRRQRLSVSAGDCRPVKPRRA